MQEIDADAVLALALARGHGWMDRETAARIATGASVAIRAVLDGDLAGVAGTSELARFLDELSALASGGS